LDKNTTNDIKANKGYFITARSQYSWFTAVLRPTFNFSHNWNCKKIWKGYYCSSTSLYCHCAA